MAEHSKIEWTEATWNPVTGCSKVSPGCAHCYAERIHDARHAAYRAGKNVPKQYATPFDKVVLHPDRLELPLHWKKPRMIFVNSMSDLFHEDVPTDYIKIVLYVCAIAPQHTFQVLTKRPKRMLEVMNSLQRCDCLGDGWARRMRKFPETKRLLERPHSPIRFPLPNVWLGVSVENQRMADKRIPLLLQTPAAVRWLSVEPLLAPVDLTSVHLGGWIYREPGKREPERFNVLQARTVFYDEGDVDYPKIDWVVVGGESGPEARPMHPAWARALRDQCVEAGVPFFFKQWGEWLETRPVAGGDLGGDARRGVVRQVELDREIDGHFRRGDVYVRRVGKKKAGRLLDGREWNQMPVRTNPFSSEAGSK